MLLSIRNRRHWLLLALALLLGASIGWLCVLLLKPRLVPADLHRFYPVSTAFYMEMAPSDRMVGRFVRYLRENPMTESAMANTDDRLLQAFEPAFSIGSWPNAASPLADDTLVVLPLRARWTLDEFVRRFKLSAEDFSQEQCLKTPCWVSRQDGNALAVADRKLLLASGKTALEHALSQFRSKRPNVFASESFKPYLAQFAAKRQGTLLLGSHAYPGAYMLASASGNLPLVTLTSGLIQFQKPLPLVAGEIHTRSQGGGELMDVRFLLPIELKQLPNEATRKRLQGFYREAAPLSHASVLPADTALMVAANDVDRLFDLYRSHIAPATKTDMFRMTEFYLSALRLNLRRDMISLLAKQTAFARRPAEGSFIFMFDKSSEKDRTVNKIGSLLATNIFPVRQHTESMDGQDLKTIVMPDGGMKIAYGPLNAPIGNQWLLATPADYPAVSQVAAGKQPSLADSESYQALMDGMPASGTLRMYQAFKALPGESSPAQAAGGPFEAMGLTLRVTPFLPDTVDLIETRLSLRLQPE